MRINRPSLLSWMVLMVTVVVCAATSACQTQKKTKNDGRQARQIYDMKAEGEAQLRTGLEQARGEDKHVLLSLGANWCSDSQKMFDVFKSQSELAQQLDDHYVLVMVDVNDRVAGQRNPTIVERYQVDLKRGIPALLVLDAEGRLLTTDPEARPKDDDHGHPGHLLNYLKKWNGDSPGSPSETQVDSQGKSSAPEDETRLGSPDSTRNQGGTHSGFPR